ncbi:MAG: mechanosensitive ion channel, partial [Pseudomonadota bacterium]|nr:mechanosensitive ion channel [Pseudomonadota bacterium]
MYSRDPQAIYWQDQAQLWIPRILGALAILVIAYILARAAKWAISKIVDRVPALKRHYEAEPGKTLGSLIGDIVFWLILLIGIMLALQPLGLSQVLEPVRQLTTQTFSFIPNLIGAGLIFVIGLVVAKILRRLTEGALLAANADGWLRRTGIANAGTAPASPAGGTATVAPRASISRTVGMLVFYVVMIPITIMALDALRIEVISGPATEMLQTIFEALPRIVAAVILLGIGYIVGKLAKQFIEQLLP